MTTILERAEQITADLTQAGVRATLEVATISPPCVLIVPPLLTFDLSCDGITVTWTLHALASAPAGGDRNTWGQLLTLVGAVRSVVNATSATSGAYVVGSVGYPSYTLLAEEAIW